jgi:putative flippase GtrA
MGRIVTPLLSLLRQPGPTGQVLRFAIVGGLAFLLDAAILQTLVGLGFGPVAGRVFSLSAAVTATWLLNRTLTFTTPRRPSWREFAHYVLVSLIGMLINYAVYSAGIFLHVPLLVALAIGTIAGATFNFFRYRQLLGAKRSHGPLDARDFDPAE